MTKEEFVNLEVGRTFELGCRKFMIVETDDENLCDNCFFDGNWRDCGKMMKENFIPECCWEDREDEKNVIFIEVEND